MFEIYEKVKHGHHIRVLALNNKIGKATYFPMIDIDMIHWNKLKWIVLDTTEECGPALSFKTRNGFHIYFPHKLCTMLSSVKNILRHFDEVVEPEYHERAVENGYYTLRVSRYHDNCVTFHRRTSNGPTIKTTTHGYELEQFIRKVISIYGKLII